MDGMTVMTVDGETRFPLIIITCLGFFCFHVVVSLPPYSPPGTLAINSVGIPVHVPPMGLISLEVLGSPDPGAEVGLFRWPRNPIWELENNTGVLWSSYFPIAARCGRWQTTSQQMACLHLSREANKDSVSSTLCQLPQAELRSSRSYADL